MLNIIFNKRKIPQQQQEKELNANASSFQTPIHSRSCSLEELTILKKIENDKKINAFEIECLEWKSKYEQSVQSQTDLQTQFKIKETKWTQHSEMLAKNLNSVGTQFQKEKQEWVNLVYGKLKHVFDILGEKSAENALGLVLDELFQSCVDVQVQEEVEVLQNNVTSIKEMDKLCKQDNIVFQILHSSSCDSSASATNSSNTSSSSCNCSDDEDVSEEEKEEQELNQLNSSKVDQSELESSEEGSSSNTSESFSFSHSEDDILASEDDQSEVSSEEDMMNLDDQAKESEITENSNSESYFDRIESMDVVTRSLHKKSPASTEICQEMTEDIELSKSAKPEVEDADESEVKSSKSKSPENETPNLDIEKMEQEESESMSETSSEEIFSEEDSIKTANQSLTDVFNPDTLKEPISTFGVSGNSNSTLTDTSENNSNNVHLGDILEIIYKIEAVYNKVNLQLFKKSQETNELHESIQQHETLCSNLGHENATLKTDLHELQTKLKQEQEQHQVASQQWKLKLEELTETNCTHEFNFKKTLTQIEKLESHVNELTQEKLNIEQALVCTEQKLKQSLVLVTQHTSSTELLETELDGLKRQHEIILGSKNVRIQVLEKSNESLSKFVEENTSKIELLKHKMSEQDKSIVDLEEEKQVLVKKKSVLEREVAESKDKIEELEQSVTKFKRTLSKVENEHQTNSNTLNQNIAQLKKKSREQDRLNKELAEELNEHKEKRQELEHNLEDITEEYKKLQEELAEAKVQIGDLENKSLNKTELIQNLQNQLEGNVKELKESKTKLKETEVELAETKTQLGESKVELEISEKECSRLREKNSKLIQEKQTLASDLSHTTSLLETRQSELNCVQSKLESTKKNLSFKLEATGLTVSSLQSQVDLLADKTMNVSSLLDEKGELCNKLENRMLVLQSAMKQIYKVVCFDIKENSHENIANENAFESVASVSTICDEVLYVFNQCEKKIRNMETQIAQDAVNMTEIKEKLNILCEIIFIDTKNKEVDESDILVKTLDRVIGKAQDQVLKLRDFIFQKFNFQQPISETPQTLTEPSLVSVIENLMELVNESYHPLSFKIGQQEVTTALGYESEHTILISSLKVILQELESLATGMKKQKPTSTFSEEEKCMKNGICLYHQQKTSIFKTLFKHLESNKFMEHREESKMEDLEEEEIDSITGKQQKQDNIAATAFKLVNFTSKLRNFIEQIQVLRFEMRELRQVCGKQTRDYTNLRQENEQVIHERFLLEHRVKERDDYVMKLVDMAKTVKEQHALHVETLNDNLIQTQKKLKELSVKSCDQEKQLVELKEANEKKLKYIAKLHQICRGQKYLSVC